MEMEKYAEQLRQIWQCLLDHGVPNEDYAVAIMQEMAKDRRMKQIAKERRNDEGQATEKQIAYLRILGVETDDDMTKTEASELCAAEFACRPHSAIPWPGGYLLLLC